MHRRKLILKIARNAGIIGILIIFLYAILLLLRVAEIVTISTLSVIELLGFLMIFAAVLLIFIANVGRVSKKSLKAGFFFILCTFLVLVVDYFWDSLPYWEQILLDVILTVALVFSILLAMSMAFTSLDTLGAFRIHGWHLHETILGIMMIFSGLILIFYGSEDEFYFGIILFAIGCFFMGRDWRDLRELKIISKD